MGRKREANPRADVQEPGRRRRRRGERARTKSAIDQATNRKLLGYSFWVGPGRTVLRNLQPVLWQIERRDRDLARQLRRCSASVALNLAEGMFSRGQNRGVRYHSALGSARETLASLEVALACGYVRHGGLPEAELLRAIGTLVKLVR